MNVNVSLQDCSYEIIIERESLNKCDFLCNYDKVLVVTDNGVPSEYSRMIMNKLLKNRAFLYVVNRGEATKCFDSVIKLCSYMLSKGFTRQDCIVAVGGGVVGDLTAFVASIYMRGIDFYNCPTTLLAMVDSSSGGKTGVNLDQVKNAVGTFYQPKKVIIDPCVLATLSKRYIACGTAEVIKMAACFDKDFFEYVLNGISPDNYEFVIQKSCKIKKYIIEKDEKEKNLRKVLNFGHTIGHGIEQACNNKLLHGESVALGMIAMTEGKVREKIIKALKNNKLPIKAKFDFNTLVKSMVHDKKAHHGCFDVISVPELGVFKVRQASLEELKERLNIVKE